MVEVKKVLIVDDEKDLCEILQFNLESEGFITDVVYSGEEALAKQLEDYSLILLDVMMGGISGFKVANIIRKERNLQMPIIFLTARGEENDILTGFSIGGDDYISKPFSVKEVNARIKAVLKRGVLHLDKKNEVSYENIRIDLDKKSVSISGSNLNLTRKEFDILALLIKNMGQYLSREDIIQRIWHEDVIVTERNVDVNIARLRKKIGEYGANLKGKSGYGYCFGNS